MEIFLEDKNVLPFLTKLLSTLIDLSLSKKEKN